MSNEQPDEGVVTSWAGIWVTGLVSFVQGAAFYAFFSYQRSKEAAKPSYDLYEPRQHTRAHRSPPPFAKKWYKAAWEVSQAETLRCVGLDTYMFLRVLRLGARLSALGTLLSIILIPVYATGEARGNATEEFNRLTLARVGQGSNRLWASLLAWCCFIAFVLYEICQEWQLYAKHRYEFLAKGDEDMPKVFRYAIRVEKVPPELRSDASLKTYFERLFPQKVQQATSYLFTDSLQRLVDKRSKVICALEEAVAVTHAKPDKPRPQVKVGAKFFGMCGGTKVDAIEHYNSEVERLNEEIDKSRSLLLQQAHRQVRASLAKASGIQVEDDNTHQTSDMNDEDEGQVTCSTGFVTFTSLRSKQAAVQCELSGHPDRMVAVAAPDPQGILWDNVTVPESKQRILQFQAGLFWCVGVLFWAVPVGFVTSISNLNSILKAFNAGPVDENSFWYGLVAGLLPVIALALLMVILYLAIVAVAKHFVRFKSMPEVDSYTLYWHQMFQFANLWLILIGGSLFNQIDLLLSDIGQVVNIIARALPGASTFFVNMVLLSSFADFGMELSLLPTYGVKLLMSILQPEAMRTQRQLDEAKKPPSVVWGQTVPRVIFIFLVVILYMPIVPIIEFFGLIYFSGMYLVWKHQCLHVYAQDFEGGGDTTWQNVFGFIMACIYTGEAVFIAYMGIKEAPTQAALSIIPFIITILVHLILSRNVIRPLKNLSLEVAANVDIEDGELSIDQEGDGKLYGQPALDADKDERGPMPYRRDMQDTPPEVEINKEVEQDTPLEVEINKEVEQTEEPTTREEAEDCLLL